MQITPSSEAGLYKKYYTGRWKYYNLHELYSLIIEHLENTIDEHLTDSSLNNLRGEKRHLTIKKLRENLKNLEGTQYQDAKKTFDNIESITFDIDSHWKKVFTLISLGFLDQTDILTKLIKVLKELADKGINPMVRPASNIELGFRLIVGQYYDSFYSKEGEECLNHNLNSLQSIPVKTRLKLGDFSEWLLVVHKSKQNFQTVYDFCKSQKQKNLFLNEDLWSLWNDLESCVPPLEFEPLWFFPLLNKKIPLHQWINTLFFDGSREQFGKNLDFFTQNLYLENLTLWDISSESNEIYYLDRTHTPWFYWIDIFSRLEKWQEIVDVNLESVRWSANEQFVRLELRWEFSLDCIDHIYFVDDEIYWAVNFLAEEIPLHIANKSNAILLNIQLLARRAGSQLNCTKNDSKHMTIELQILKAEQSFLIESPISGKVAESIICKSMNPILQNYSIISRQLEAVLFEDTKRLSNFIPSFEIPDHVDKNIPGNIFIPDPKQKMLYELKEIIKELIWLRETLTSHVENN